MEGKYFKYYNQDNNLNIKPNFKIVWEYCGRFEKSAPTPLKNNKFSKTIDIIYLL